jgi:predicted Fe-Mo cluster-binding NifX family protein
MKIAVSSTGKSIESDVSDVFARCPYFIFAEIEKGEIMKTEAMENGNNDQSGGVGISSSRLMAEKNVEAVITGNVGPRAMDVLKQFEIEIYPYKGSVKDALNDFIQKKIKK